MEGADAGRPAADAAVPQNAETMIKNNAILLTDIFPLTV